jgi:hypothetical protein
MWTVPTPNVGPVPSTPPPLVRHCEEASDAAVHFEPFRTANPIHALWNFTRWVLSGWPRRSTPRHDVAAWLRKVYTTGDRHLFFVPAPRSVTARSQRRRGSPLSPYGTTPPNRAVLPRRDAGFGVDGHVVPLLAMTWRPGFERFTPTGDRHLFFVPAPDPSLRGASGDAAVHSHPTASPHRTVPFYPAETLGSEWMATSFHSSP